MNDKRNKLPAARGSDQGTRVDLRREVIEYLRAHPEAADTVDGILDWWIPSQRNENAKNEIQLVLHELVQQGLIEEVVLGNGNRLYRLPGGKDKQS
jgi:Fe2+ or Zn2+ uptake regulation protein